jgi:hypothetical protein
LSELPSERTEDDSAHESDELAARRARRLG